MEKLRNNLFNAAVRSRQSSLFRAQQIAESALYDNEPELFNTDLQTYLNVTADQIRDVVAQHLDTDNRVLLKSVSIARDLGAVIELASGIAPNDRVIENPPDGVGNGALVQLAGAPAASVVAGRAEAKHETG